MPVRDRMLSVLLLGAALAVMPSARSFASDRPASLRATLILASNEPAAQDPRLDTVEYKLRRVFGFEYYRHYGENTAAVAIPGSTSLTLGHGNRLQIHLSGAGDNRLRAQVQWFRGEDLVLNTTVVVDRRAPVVLGGVSHENGTLIVTLQAE